MVACHPSRAFASMNGSRRTLQGSARGCAKGEDVPTGFKLLGSSALAVGCGGAVSAGVVDMRVFRMLWSLFIRSLGASALASLLRLEMDDG